MAATPRRTTIWAMRCARSARFDEALEQYQRALLIRENYAGAYNNMAAILRDRDQVAEAEFAYRKAIALNPRYFEAYGNLATLLVQHERRG